MVHSGTESSANGSVRKQRRGKQVSPLARLKANGRRPAIPSFLIANVRSLDNKVDVIWLQLNPQ